MVWWLVAPFVFCGVKAAMAVGVDYLLERRRKG